jgi:hypothetical protein
MPTASNVRSPTSLRPWAYSAPSTTSPAAASPPAIGAATGVAGGRLDDARGCAGDVQHVGCHLEAIASRLAGGDAEPREGEAERAEHWVIGDDVPDVPRGPLALCQRSAMVAQGVVDRGGEVAGALRGGPLEHVSRHADLAAGVRCGLLEALDLTSCDDHLDVGGVGTAQLAQAIVRPGELVEAGVEGVLAEATEASRFLERRDDELVELLIDGDQRAGEQLGGPGRVRHRVLDPVQRHRPDAGRVQVGVGLSDEGPDGLAHEGDGPLGEHPLQVVEIACRVGRGEVGQEVAVAFAAAPGHLGSLRDVGPLLVAGERDRNSLPELATLVIVGETARRVAGRRASQIPADQVEGSGGQGVEACCPLASATTPESPGPPGLKNSAPIRVAVSGARWRITASEIIGPRGWSQSRGTATVAHSKPDSHCDHATAARTGSEDWSWPAAAGDTAVTTAPMIPSAATSATRKTKRVLIERSLSCLR